MFLFIIVILMHPLILYGNLVLASYEALEEPHKFEMAEIPLAANVTSLKSQVNVSEDQIIYLLSSIESYMNQNKPFLNNNYTIQLLSVSLDIPVYHCSFLLNQVALKSFRDYINGFRIQYFITTYGSSKNKFTIEYQTSLVGFNNRGTFYTAFTKETGLTPKQYFDQPDFSESFLPPQS